MKVTIEKLNEYIAQYIRGYIVPNVKKKSTLFKIGAAHGLGLLSIDGKKLGELKELGVADDDGIEVDKLKKAVNGGLEMAGELYIEKLGITLYRAEIEKFFHLVETGTLS